MVFPCQTGIVFSKAPDNADPELPAIEPVDTPVAALLVVDVEEAVDLVRDGNGVALNGVGSDQVAVIWLKEASASAEDVANMLMVVVVVTSDESTVLMERKMS
jgi:hypothetical protein